MHFPHIFLFTSVTSRSSIDINVISIFNNQHCMYMKIIKIQFFVNNVVCFTAYLANATLFYYFDTPLKYNIIILQIYY